MSISLYRLSNIPTPSIIARINPPITAEPAIAAGPSEEKMKIRLVKRVQVNLRRACKTAPVNAPLIIEFHGSSFFLK